MKIKIKISNKTRPILKEDKGRVIICVRDHHPGGENREIPQGDVNFCKKGEKAILKTYCESAYPEDFKNYIEINPLPGDIKENRHMHIRPRNAWRVLCIE